MFTKLYVKGQVLLNDLMKNQRGVTAIEYAIVAVAVSGAVTLAFGDGATGGLVTALSNAVTAVANKLPKI